MNCYIPRYQIQEQVRQALDEDLGSGDLSARLVSNHTARATLVVREDAVLCGQAWFQMAFELLDNQCQIQWFAEDGEAISTDQEICRIRGRSQALLSGERTAINFLQTLSATATITREYVEQLNQPKIHLLDTRKTIPGLRLAQKYAVVCGGGHNHRHGLSDGILIKENHILAAGGIDMAIKKARQQLAHGLKIEVEVENLDEVSEAIRAGADILLLDNMDHHSIEQAIKIRKQLQAQQVQFEVSGNITLSSLKQLANLEIQYISTGSLTKHIRAIDFSMRFESQ